MRLGLSEWQLDKTSDISISVGQVFFASVLIDPLVSGNTGPSRIFIGISLAVIFWVISILLIKK